MAANPLQSLQIFEITSNKVTTHADFQANLEALNRLDPNLSAVMANNAPTEIKALQKNKIKSIEVFDNYDAEISDSKTFDPDKAMQAGEIITYKVKLDGKVKTTVEQELKSIKFCLWLEDENGKEISIKSPSKTILIATKGNFISPDQSSSFFLVKTRETLLTNLEKAYFYAEIEHTAEEAILRIKFSKWLDRYMVKVAAYFTKIVRDEKASTAYNFVKAYPEVLDGYWANANEEKITTSGYQQEVFLCLETLGMKDSEVALSVYDYNYSGDRKEYLQEIDWDKNSMKISDTKSLVKFKIGKETDEDYKNARENSTADLKLFFDALPNVNVPNLQFGYGRYLHLTTKETLVDAYFAKRVIKEIDRTTSITEYSEPGKESDDSSKERTEIYQKIDFASIGQKTYLVVEAHNLEGKQVKIKIFEKEPLLEGKGKPIAVTYKEAGTTEFCVDIDDTGKGVAEITLNPGIEKEYEEWIKKFDPILKNNYEIKGTCDQLEMYEDDPQLIECPTSYISLGKTGEKPKINYLWLEVNCAGDDKQHKGTFLKEKKERLELSGAVEPCKIDADYFFKMYDKQFSGKLTEDNKTSLKRMFVAINEYYFNEKRCCNLKHITYMLATTKHETDNTYNPIKEYGGKKYLEGKYDPVLGSDDYYKARAKKHGNTTKGDGVKYSGKGFVQLTWKPNYQKMKKKFGVDIVNFPDKAMDFDLAVKIMIYGMEVGTFSPGQTLSKYINSKKTDYLNARRIINGRDKATLVKGYAIKIEKCLRIKKCTC